ncbi:exopolysaccharide production repressor protein [Neorhizobium galegae]|uniref:exopolysaccharide production repressor protein n=1 Tax=Neorhizobium galegae TaxID=399 RepID=UPI00358EE61E
MSLFSRKSVKLAASPASLIHITIVSIVFGIITYYYDRDFRTSLIYTSACFLLLQFGYFAGIVYMAWLEHKRRSQ